MVNAVVVIIVVLVGVVVIWEVVICVVGVFIRVVIFEMVEVCVRRMFRVGALDCIRMYRTYALIISSGNGIWGCDVLCVVCV